MYRQCQNENIIDFFCNQLIGSKSSLRVCTSYSLKDILFYWRTPRFEFKSVTVSELLIFSDRLQKKPLFILIITLPVRLKRIPKYSLDREKPQSEEDASRVLAIRLRSVESAATLCQMSTSTSVYHQLLSQK